MTIPTKKRNPALYAGIGAVVVAILLIVGVTVMRGGDDDTTPAAAPTAAAPATIHCLIGGEKEGLLRDPAILKILDEKFHLKVSFETLGSYAQVALPKDELARKGVNCLWPSSLSAAHQFESNRKGDFPDAQVNNVLVSPEVIYAGPQGTKILSDKGLVTQQDGRYYVVDMKAMLQVIQTQQTWQSLGANGPGPRGPVKISSSNPARSNSGFTLYQMLINILGSGDPDLAASPDQARAHLPEILAIQDVQGAQADSSDRAFENWYTQGGEQASPLLAGYENQAAELFAQQGDPAGAKNKDLTDNVRVIYPNPTVNSDHPLITLDDTAAPLMQALRDPEIQGLAWKNHGFRSAVDRSLNDPAAFGPIHLSPGPPRSTPAPSKDVSDILLACLKDRTKCTATP